MLFFRVPGLDHKWNFFEFYNLIKKEFFRFQKLDQDFFEFPEVDQEVFGVGFNLEILLKKL